MNNNNKYVPFTKNFFVPDFTLSTLQLIAKILPTINQQSSVIVKINDNDSIINKNGTMIIIHALGTIVLCLILQKLISEVLLQPPFSRWGN